MTKIAVIGMVGNSAFLPVEQFPADGDTAKAVGIHFEPGGKGFNQAVAAARFGAEVSFLGAVGEEGCETIRAFAKNEGIHAVLPQKPGQTAYAAITTEKSGANRVTVWQGPALTLADVDTFAGTVADADILLLSNEVPEAVNLRAAEIARDAGTKIILNPAPARPICRELCDLVTLFTPNEHEEAALGGRKNCIVTLGSQGCLLKESGIRLPAVICGKTVDTTGAGDTFTGVLAAELARGLSLGEAAKTAGKAAGISVTRPYAATAIPTRAEAETESP